ncbi:protein white isoform X2 [Tribolium madens]|nr:protein white isoform X2 [Tribolium madens]
MENETQSLLSGVVSQINGNSGDSTNSATSIDLSTFRVPTYGTTTHPTSKLVPPDERITYSWSEINAFANVSPSKTKFLNFIKRRDSPVQKKHILKNVFGVAYPGELLAILGSSGAGKTTLLNTLTFHTTSNLTVSGLRCVNGTPVSSKTLASQSAYVQQDDLFIGTLTVREHLIFQALLRMDRDISYNQRMARVEEVISDLALTKCQNTQIGILGRIKGISGGEKKRLSFAAEVLTNPKLMFCDEPTSGLDSFMALTVMQVLKEMAMTGKTVICTIHQPSSEVYSMFDKLLLMSEGRTAFLGSPEEAETFFREIEAPCPKNYNPADYFIQLLAIVPEKEESSRQAVNLICDKFERSNIGVKIALEAATAEREGGYYDIWINGESFKSPYKASCWAQFKAVLWRSLLAVFKEPLLIKVRLLQTLIISLVIGAIYFGQVLNQDGVMNINGVLFVFLTNMTFQNVFAVINVFSGELPVFLHEHRNGMYRPSIYFISKTLAESPIFIIIPVILTSVCYFMIGLNSQGFRFYIACGIMILVANVAISFGYLISCVSRSVSMALSIGPPLVIPFLLFGGFFLNVSSIPVYFKWLSYLSWFRYGNGALMINQWENVTNIQCPNADLPCPKDGHVILEIFHFSEADFVMDVVMLAVLIIGFRLVAFLALIVKTYRFK